MKQDRCECCGGGAQVKHIDLCYCKVYEKDVSYVFCRNCETDFVLLNLSPEQFRNLIKNGHSQKEFMLHSDVYDEDGIAQQPMEIRRI